MSPGDRVRIVGGEFAGKRATVVQDQAYRVYVLIDRAGHNPVPFKPSQLRAAR